MKQTVLLFLTTYLLLTATVWAQTTKDPSAALEINSTTQGLLPPRMTSLERDAITDPSRGLMIYNTTTNKLNLFNSTLWIELSGLYKGLEADAVQINSFENNVVAYSYTSTGTGTEDKGTTVVNFYSANQYGENRTLVKTTDGVPTAWTIDDFSIFSANYYLIISVKLTSAPEIFSSPPFFIPPPPIFFNGLTYKAMVSAGTGEVWLDRNIGASAAPSSITDTGDAFRGTILTWASINMATACPTGYRLPTKVELEAEVASLAANGGKNNTGAFNVLNVVPNGWEIGGNLAFVDSSSGIWANESNTYLYINSTTAAVNTNGDGWGFNIRCIKDD